MSLSGPLFVFSGLYLTLIVALVVSLLDASSWKGLLVQTARRWGKFLLGLVILGFVVQILTVFTN